MKSILANSAGFHDFLTSANYGSGATTWTYDAAGNRSATGSNTSYTYDNLNRMSVSPNGTGTHSYTHDILGNRISRDYVPGQAGQPSTSARLYSWDVLNRMTATAGDSAGEGARYLYRADGMRAEKIEDISLSWVENPNADDGSGFYDPIYTTNKPTTRYWYDGQMAIEEDFMETTEQTRDPYRKRYGIGARGIDYIDLFVDGSYQGCQFPVYDGHGNMILTLARASSNGYSLANERYYDAWGAVNFTDNIQAIPPSQTYCANLGHVEDSESGLQYMRARYYEPSTGRFISQDPGYQGANWFIYCGNQPIVCGDANGKWFHLLIGAIFGGLSAAVFGSISGYTGWKLTFTIAVGVISGILSAMTGAWIAELVKGSAGIVAGGAGGGAFGGLINTLYDEITSGRPINWNRVFRNIGIGGIAGLCGGAIGGLAQKNGEIAAAIAGVDGDVIANSADTILTFQENH